MSSPATLPGAGAPRTPPKVRRPEPAPRVATPASALAAFRAESRSPVVEPDGEEWIVTFFWRDADADEVLLFVNRLTDERDLDRSLMERVPGTEEWQLSYRMPGDWRASYAMVPKRPGRPAPWRDLAEQASLRAALDRGLPDPLNPQRMRNRVGNPVSVVELPDAPAQAWLAPRGPLRGELTRHDLDGRRPWVYRPAEFTAGGPVLVALDGEMWVGELSLPAQIDNLIADGLIQAPLVLLVPGGDRLRRWAELNGSGGMPDWIADVLLPWAVTGHDAGTDAADRLVAGQSLGGAVALLTAAERPDAVGAFLAQSASLWQEGLADRAAAMPATTRGYLEVGRQEWVLLGPNRELHRRLDASGVRHDYAEFNGGHDYACWRGGIADGLRALLGVRAG
ncbi:MAG: DUF3327 domain-containing protein [Micropruina sp.]|uniref:enterochelin esterase domain-containing protein n=1 Tax=Micropruina sp. TaxID=2737536 RepID=UPI0039E67E97